MRILLRIIYSFIIILSVTACSRPAKSTESKLSKSLDSLLLTDSVRPFNGVVLISQNGRILYEGHHGYARFEDKTALQGDEQFVIGSVSKQITAVLVLQQMDHGRLKLTDPLNLHLTDMKQSWASQVTIHQLLNHTHGITGLNDSLAFAPGSQFQYSGLGYELLAKIAEKCAGTHYTELVSGLFKQCGMKHSYDPRSIDRRQIVAAYTRQNDKIVPELHTFDTICVPAGWLVSTASDMTRWNENLHNGRILSKASYKLMTSASSSRMHTVWGKVDYGYGIQMSNYDQLSEIGHTGYVPGYITMNFYYPETKTSLIVLENLDWADDNITKVFDFEKRTRQMLRTQLLKQQ